MRAALALCLALLASCAAAQSEKPVRFVVGFTPGGPSDILARALGQKLAERCAVVTASARRRPDLM